MTAGQRVLITAGASGIGRAMAEAFAGTGARVWVADVDEAALRACPEDWRKSGLVAAIEARVGDLLPILEALRPGKEYQT